MFVRVIKMLQYDRIDVSKGIDINKTSASKDVGYKFQPYVCNGCHAVLMMVYELKNIATLNAKGADCRYISWSVSKYDAISRLNNPALDDKGVL